jgi:hypothetical protein
MNRRDFMAVYIAGLLTVGWRDAIDALLGGGIGGRARPSMGRVVHPDPRPGVTAEHVLAVDSVKMKPRIAELYDMAREIPQVFDGLYCYCHCHDSNKHRSLLTCFESEQPTGCYGCGAAARLAYQEHKAGKSLDQIRAACDKKFG